MKSNKYRERGACLFSFVSGSEKQKAIVCWHNKLGILYFIQIGLVNMQGRKEGMTGGNEDEQKR